MHLGWSSHVYPLDAADLAGVPDYDGPDIPACDLPGDEVVLLIRREAPDALLRGRAAIEAAGAGTVIVANRLKKVVHHESSHGGHGGGFGGGGGFSGGGGSSGGHGF